MLAELSSAPKWEYYNISGEITQEAKVFWDNDTLGGKSLVKFAGVETPVSHYINT